MTAAGERRLADVVGLAITAASRELYIWPHVDGL
jgi:hypothetical protein